MDVFYEGLYEKIQESRFPYDQRRILFTEFWRKVFSSGNITDPRWEKSEGATDEHETAKKLDLAIHYL